MNFSLRLARFTAVLTLAAHIAAAGDAIVVETASGRQFRGEVDPRTDEQSLWLRSGKANAFFQRPIAWNRITSVQARQNSYTPVEFRRLIVTPDWQWAGDPFADDFNQAAATQPQTESIVASDPTAELVHAASWQVADDQPSASPRVVSVHIDAHVANWDYDVEVDGLVVCVSPLDQYGNLVPALGTVDVDLIGEGYTNLVSGNPFPFLGRWSQVVRPEDVGPNGAVFKFPFQWSDPSFNQKWSLGSFGMVHARLTVGGDGVFEDTASFTRIRPYSPVRDRMQQLRGTRYSPWELTSYPYR